MPKSKTVTKQKTSDADRVPKPNTSLRIEKSEKDRLWVIFKWLDKPGFEQTLSKVTRIAVLEGLKVLEGKMERGEAYP